MAVVCDDCVTLSAVVMVMDYDCNNTDVVNVVQSSVLPRFAPSLNGDGSLVMW